MTCSRSLREDMVNPGPKPSSILQDSPGASGWRLGAFSSPGCLRSLGPPRQADLEERPLARKFIETAGETTNLGFSGGLVDENPPASAKDMCSIPGPGRSHTPRSNQVSAPHLVSLCPVAWEPWLLKACT